MSFLAAFLQLGNPFLQEDSSLVRIPSRPVLGNASSESVKSTKDIDKQRLKTGFAPLYDSIKENNIALFRYKNDIFTSNSK